MKKNIVSILAYAVLGLSTLMVSCGGDSQTGDSNNVTNVASEMAFLRADISGMTCAVGCAKTIEKMLSETEGVSSAEVDYEKKAAFINYDKAKVSEADLLKAISKFKDGSYAAKVSDKNCKSDCKKACCAVEKVVKETTNKIEKTTNKVGKTVRKVEKTVEKSGNDIKASTTTAVKTLNTKAIKKVTQGKKMIHETSDRATKEIKSATKEVNQNIDAIKKSAIDVNSQAGKKVKNLNDTSKRMVK